MPLICYNIFVYSLFAKFCCGGPAESAIFMEKKNRTKLTIIVAAVIAIVISLCVFVAATTYDSTNDPLISLSYLTKYVNEMIEPIKAAISSGGGSAKADAFEAIFVEYGKEIQCTAATEVILRSGTAVIVSPFDNQGLCDLTGGVDLKGGVSVPKNHNLLIPRGSDGRGIKITSSNGAYVMVGGAYIIVEP